MIIRKYAATLALLAVSACNQDSGEKLPDLYNEAGSAKATASAHAQKPVPVLSAADFIRVCKAAQAFRVGRDVSTIKGETTDKDIVRLSYTRDDGKPFRYDCRIDDGQVRTRMIDEAGPGSGPGQWSGRGSTTTFELKDGGIYVHETYPDGSSDADLIKI